MFYLVESKILQNNKVKYSDEKGNSLTIFMDMGGESLKGKLRLKESEYKIDAITLFFPYDIDGINFTIKKETSEVFDVPKSLIKVLQEVILILERWVNISFLLYQLNTNNQKELFKLMDSEKINEEASKENLVYSIIEELQEFEETAEITKVYLAIMK